VGGFEDSATSITQQLFRFTQRYLSFFFMAMGRHRVTWEEADDSGFNIQARKFRSRDRTMRAYEAQLEGFHPQLSR